MFTRSSMKVFQASCVRLGSSDSPAKDVASNIVNAQANYPKPNTKAGDKKLAEGVTNSLPEPPTTCCMSGCANCVWLDYVEKLNEYYKDGGDKAMQAIEEEITDSSLKAFLLHEFRMRQKS